MRATQSLKMEIEPYSPDRMLIELSDQQKADIIAAATAKFQAACEELCEVKQFYN